MNIEEAINEMIAQTVCESENLICEKDCPYYNKRKKKCTVLDKDFEPEKAVEGLKTVLNELEKKDKRISDLEFALMDMVLQFADESKDKIGTMGLSALEIAFSELDFDNPMSIEEVHKRYKKLGQEYYKVEREGK